MKTALIISLIALFLVMLSESAAQSKNDSYLGFDRNAYPGNATSKPCTKLSPTPATGSTILPAKRQTWSGHRAAVESAGFGFLVLFNGRLYAELKTVANAVMLVNPMRMPPRPPRAAKASHRELSSFSIRSKVGACWRSRRHICMPG